MVSIKQCEIFYRQGLGVRHPTSSWECKVIWNWPMWPIEIGFRPDQDEARKAKDNYDRVENWTSSEAPIASPNILNPHRVLQSTTCRKLADFESAQRNKSQDSKQRQVTESDSKEHLLTTLAFKAPKVATGPVHGGTMSTGLDTKLSSVLMEEIENHTAARSHSLSFSARILLPSGTVFDMQSQVGSSTLERLIRSVSLGTNSIIRYCEAHDYRRVRGQNKEKVAGRFVVDS